MKYVYDYASAGTPTNRKPCYVRSNFLSLGYCGLPAGAAVFLLFLPIQRHLCCRADALCRVPMGWSSWRSTAAISSLRRCRPRCHLRSCSTMPMASRGTGCSQTHTPAHKHTSSMHLYDEGGILVSSGQQAGRRPAAAGAPLLLFFFAGTLQLARRMYFFLCRFLSSNTPEITHALHTHSRRTQIIYSTHTPTPRSSPIHQKHFLAATSKPRRCRPRLRHLCLHSANAYGVSWSVCLTLEPVIFSSSFARMYHYQNFSLCLESGSVPRAK
jgi:hypothetical protein